MVGQGRVGHVRLSPLSLLVLEIQGGGGGEQVPSTLCIGPQHALAAKGKNESSPLDPSHRDHWSRSGTNEADIAIILTFLSGISHLFPIKILLTPSLACCSMLENQLRMSKERTNKAARVISPFGGQKQGKQKSRHRRKAWSVINSHSQALPKTKHLLLKERSSETS